jgi:uncharacterized glyoxalase superfamily protein PhnB
MATKKKAKKTQPAKARPKKATTPKDTAPRLRDASPSFTVNDLDRSLAFYRDVLGFRVAEAFQRDGKTLGYMLRAGDVDLMIGQDDWAKGRDRRKGEGFRMYFETATDVDAFAKGIQARGGTIDGLPEDRPWGYRDFSLTDPDGFKMTFGVPLKKR